MKLEIWYKKEILEYELYSTLVFQASKVQSRASTVKSTRPDRDVGPLVPFEELVSTIEVGIDESFKKEEDDHKNVLEDCTMPDPGALLHVTNRRKVPLRKKSLPVVCNTTFSIFPSVFFIFLVFGNKPLHLS